MYVNDNNNACGFLRRCHNVILVARNRMKTVLLILFLYQ